MKNFSKYFAKLLFLYIAFFSLFISCYNPCYNWDIIGYIASAKWFEEKNIKKLHSFTYSQLKKSIPSHMFKILTESSPYRKAVYKDPLSFKEQLPFYQIRPIYTGLIYFLYKLGMSITVATYFVSGFSIFIAILVLYFISHTLLPDIFLISIPFFAIIYGIFDLSRLSTPDALMFLFVIFTAYLYLKGRINILLIILPLLIGIRIDLIIFSSLFYLFLFFQFANLKKQIIFSSFISILLYSFITTYWHHPGWKTIFYFTLIKILPYPLSNPPNLTIKHYFYALFRGILQSHNNKPFILFFIVNIYLLYFLIKDKRSLKISFPEDKIAILSVISSLYVYIHFLLFPVFWLRFFSAPYLISTICLLYFVSISHKNIK